MTLKDPHELSASRKPGDYPAAQVEDVVNLLLHEVLSEGLVDVRPILHNDGVVILQFQGWSINLYADGTWIWEATDGG